MVNSCTKFKVSSISRLGDISYNIGCTSWWQSEICIVINDKSQGNIAQHLSGDGYFITNVSLNLLVKEFL